jgi:hypothetical protein
MALLAALLRDESLTYTAFTPAPISWAALLAQRFSQLGSHRIVIPPLEQAEAMLGPNRPASIRPWSASGLTCQQRQIFDDHAPHDCLQLIISDGSSRGTPACSGASDYIIRGIAFGEEGSLGCLYFRQAWKRPRPPPTPADRAMFEATPSLIAASSAAPARSRHVPLVRLRTYYRGYETSRCS